MSLGGAVGAAASIGGGIVSAIGGNDAASQQSDADLEKQQADLFNQTIAERNEAYTKEALPLELEQQHRQNEAQLGTIRAAYGASGLDMSGSALDVLKGTARAQVFNQQLTKFQSAITAQQYDDQAKIAGQDAEIEQANAASAESGGFLSTLGAIFGAGSSLSKNSSVTSALGFST